MAGHRKWGYATLPYTHKYLEMGKFSLYLFIPIFSMLYVASEPVMNFSIGKFQYIVYPEEAPRPPVGEAFLAYMEERDAKEKAARQAREKTVKQG
mmetsp:Transcript_18888/g.32747  ORF Transcript_18888/g.32747 Transcript_18888/m.32747 type:complete len:95 (+) Transcript_18888:95-379(+)|eukprot:CAMPEP_0184691800 /NCGR_PEP_ID=MMETSP0313-20130426/531_1 /TAXON_ID=2792 /ORGANISM="Porphyridium aerugineum, Strain SAG 1380-2" /LENGTH=94 /DNA_ID=CAMNT_0027149565 /DNA_START=94 /DNA_END=378 /DNA_ORIENTATION=+